MLQDNTYVEENSWEPLDCKEIKPVNPKGNQSWIVIGRTDDEAPILWPPDAKSWLIRKDPDAGNPVYLRYVSLSWSLGFLLPTLRSRTLGQAIVTLARISSSDNITASYCITYAS